MLKDLSGVINGKTALGVFLGAAVALFYIFNNVNESLPFAIPEIINTILVGLPSFLTLFGVWDSAQAEFESLSKKLSNFLASSPAFGIIINILIQTIDNLPNLGVPQWVEISGIFVGGFLVIFGFKGQMVNSRVNLINPSAVYTRKYNKG